MTKTSESVLFLFSPPMQACFSLSSAPTIMFVLFDHVDKVSNNNGENDQN